MVNKKKNRQQEPAVQNAGDSTDSNEEDQSGSTGGKCCPHVGKAVDFQKVKKSLKPGGLVSDCAECSRSAVVSTESPPGLSLCLKCGHQGCGVHALGHTRTPRSDSHALAVNTHLWTLWCYDCDMEIDAACRKKIHECIEYLKRLDSPKRARKPVLNGKHSDGEVESPTQSRTGVSGKAAKETAREDDLPRVRGLKNLGNTCFFNAVLQCLAQTPFLLPLLEETKEPGAPFRLPGGPNLFSQDGEHLPPLEGQLGRCHDLTEQLADTLRQLLSGRAEVCDPRPLLDRLARRCPQFSGCDQHDAHELLRHLLEEVRTDDLKRYQREVLSQLGLSTKSARSDVDERCRLKVKTYGVQAQGQLLHPEHVFRGELISTLECQDCLHHSARVETFLDLSLPVSSDKPQPPILRKKNSADTFDHSSAKISDNQPSKHQLKKERRHARKMRKTKRGQHSDHLETELANGNTNSVESEHSDADIEDNLDHEVSLVTGHDNGESGYSSEKAREESGGSSPQLGLPLFWEDDDTANGDSALANGDSALASPGSPTLDSKEAPGPCRELPFSETNPTPTPPAVVVLPPPDSILSEAEAEERPASRFDFHEEEMCRDVEAVSLEDSLGGDRDGKTLATRYQCTEGECSVQSCLNQFTALELMTGNNKVGCENCTQRINRGKEGKVVCTNSTKQMLVSTPPAVLILHLKRFQVQTGALRKITRHVPFPLLLDIASICSTKCKDSSTVRPDQTQILYSLYGVVEHSGTLRSGHYVAFVKVRAPPADGDPRWSFVGGERRPLRTEDARTAAEGGTAGPPPGHWYHVSDGRVKRVEEELVLRSQAYLLFYERIW